MDKITLEIGPNLLEAIKAIVLCPYYCQHGGVGSGIRSAFNINFAKGNNYEIGPNLLEAIKAIVLCPYYCQHGKVDLAIKDAFNIDFAKCGNIKKMELLHYQFRF